MTSNITVEQIKHIASLAKINLSKKEIIKFKAQLTEIVKYFDKLSEVDTHGIDPTSQITDLKNRLRKDEIIHFLKREKALQNAPQRRDGYFVTKTSINRDAKN
ncbi:MAG: Asp-tRNA(Asn)/Glu-tRNA(Gln) amidotransferase subunit GatC [Candidatus Dojkabacteria bacterium]|nr:Asp-tRNA(Asn)/Glu-tRNA(Gln) amidotransferase subunit GatC [Candidatus Dojkabacteria bacterium]